MEKEIKPIVMPRFEEDVVSMKRTIIHFESINGSHSSDFVKREADTDRSSFEEGDVLLLCERVDDRYGMEVILKSIRKVTLCSLTEEDCVKLNCSKQDYIERWNKIHPNHQVGNPALLEEAPVWELEFEYTKRAITVLVREEYKTLDLSKSSLN